MVRQNKEDCFEIAIRVAKLSAFLPRLENTEMIKDPALIADLKKLVNTFHHAQELVTACSQGSRSLLACQGVVNVRKDRELSKELHEVLDQMVLDFDSITEISISYYQTGKYRCTPLRVVALSLNIQVIHIVTRYTSCHNIHQIIYL